MNGMPTILRVDYIGPSRIQYSGTLGNNFTLTNVSSAMSPQEYPVDFDNIALSYEKAEKNKENDRT